MRTDTQMVHAYFLASAFDGDNFLPPSNILPSKRRRCIVESSSDDILPADNALAAHEAVLAGEAITAHNVVVLDEVMPVEDDLPLHLRLQDADNIDEDEVEVECENMTSDDDFEDGEPGDARGTGTHMIG